MESFTKANLFKCYFFDVGLLGAMLDLTVKDIVDQNYGITKGYFAENFVAQELVASNGLPLYSWSERNSEIEFLVKIDSEIIPVEVKSSKRTQVKSLKQYIQKYAPKKAVILSPRPLSCPPQQVVMNIPLYLAASVPHSCDAHWPEGNPCFLAKYP